MFSLKSFLVFLVFLSLSLSADQVQYPDFEKPQQRREFKKQTIQASYKLIQDQATRSQISSSQIKVPVSVDQYNLATYVFNAQRYFPMCERCQKFQYFAFKVGSRYLTAKTVDLRLETASSPNNDQLFIGEQQIDGTWAFKSLTQNKYIRASNDGTTINWQTFVGPWERWYIQRHGAHCHIQSANFVYSWWIFSGPLLQQLNGGASSVVVQHWPKIKWLWNW